MRYVDWTEFVTMYADAMTPTEFDRFEYDAEMVVDDWVRTVDGVNKLRVAFPTNFDDSQAVKRCICALTMALKDINDTERLSISPTGLVASVSSGSESMSFQRGGTALATAIADGESRARYYGQIIKRYLAGKADANGVNLLFGGRYPIILKDGVADVS